MLNRCGVKSGALSLKMHLELALVVKIFLLYFFIILLEHGAFSSIRSFFNVILLIFHSKFSVHLLHTTYIYIYLYKNKS